MSEALILVAPVDKKGVSTDQQFLFDRWVLALVRHVRAGDVVTKSMVLRLAAHPELLTTFLVESLQKLQLVDQGIARLLVTAAMEGQTRPGVQPMIGWTAADDVPVPFWGVQAR